MTFFLYGLAFFVFWFVCGAINVAIWTKIEGLQSKTDKQFLVGFGAPLLAILIVMGIVMFPAKWAATAGTRIGEYLNRKF